MKDGNFDPVGHAITAIIVALVALSALMVWEALL